MAEGDGGPHRTQEGIIIHEGLPHKRKVLYGNLLWDGALSLARYLARDVASVGPSTRAIELGAGTGVVGLTLGALGAGEVCVTDNEPELVELMSRNIEANALGARVAPRLLDWTEPATYSTATAWDLVVAADVLYEGDGTLFARALRAHMGIGTVAYVSNHHNPDRCVATMGFLSAAWGMGLQIERLEDAEGRSVGSLRGGGGGGDLFSGSRFVPLDPARGADAYRAASFPGRWDGNHIKNIQIFRLRVGPLVAPGSKL